MKLTEARFRNPDIAALEKSFNSEGSTLQALKGLSFTGDNRNIITSIGIFIPENRQHNIYANGIRVILSFDNRQPIEHDLAQLEEQLSYAEEDDLPEDIVEAIKNFLADINEKITNIPPRELSADIKEKENRLAAKGRELAAAHYDDKNGEGGKIHKRILKIGNSGKLEPDVLEDTEYMAAIGDDPDWYYLAFYNAYRDMYDDFANDARQEGRAAANLKYRSEGIENAVRSAQELPNIAEIKDWIKEHLVSINLLIPDPDEPGLSRREQESRQNAFNRFMERHPEIDNVEKANYTLTSEETGNNNFGIAGTVRFNAKQPNSIIRPLVDICKEEAGYHDYNIDSPWVVKSGYLGEVILTLFELEPDALNNIEEAFRFPSNKYIIEVNDAEDFNIGKYYKNTCLDPDSEDWEDTACLFTDDLNSAAKFNSKEDAEQFIEDTFYDIFAGDEVLTDDFITIKRANEIKESYTPGRYRRSSQADDTFRDRTNNRDDHWEEFADFMTSGPQSEDEMDEIDIEDIEQDEETDSPKLALKDNRKGR